MSFTFGFFIIFIFIIFPGLIIRRLFFFSEFSKQFGFSDPLLKNLSYAIIPGFVNFCLTYFLYDNYIKDLDLGLIIDLYKNIINPEFLFSNEDSESLEMQLIGYSPFLGFQYGIAILIGILSGRTIRFFNLDTRFKLLRYKNYWFYLTTGQHRKLKKYKDKKSEQGEFIFSRADVLIDTTDGSKLFSGILVDYELNHSDYSELSKVVLRKARRYKKDTNGKVISRPIPGKLFVVDCKNLLNINFTHYYQKQEAFIHSKYPNIINKSFGTLMLSLLPLLFFQVSFININLYTDFFELNIFSKILYAVFLLSLINFFNPIEIDKDSKSGYKWSSKKFYFNKLLVIIVFYIFARGTDFIWKSLSQWLFA